MALLMNSKLRPARSVVVQQNSLRYLFAAVGICGAIGCSGSSSPTTQSGSGGQNALGGATGAGGSTLGGSSAESSAGASATGGREATGGSLAAGGTILARRRQYRIRRGLAYRRHRRNDRHRWNCRIRRHKPNGRSKRHGGRNAAGGVGGQAGSTGGSTGAQGGSSTGGTKAGAGGVATGGAPTGGTTSAQPQLVTSASGAYWVTTGTLTQVSSGTATVTVNDSSAAQTWEGFGGAFNEMGWNYLQMLSQSDRDSAMQLLFGNNGCRFAFGRIPIGASDYAMSRYTDDELASGQTDPTMASFSITRDQQYLIPFVQAALAIKSDIRLWASPWTPPTWMKTGPYTTPATVPSPFDGGNMTDSDSILKAYAQYFVKFVQGYAQQGITIEAVAPQNEPSYAENYPSCIWATSLFTKFVGQYLGPAFDSAGLTTKIMLGTMSANGATADSAIVASVMGDATAKGYIKVLGYQWTMLDHVAAAKSYNLPIWQTEHQCGNYPWESGYVSSAAPNDQAYGVETWGLIRDWVNAGVTAYSAWNMVLDTAGNGINTTRDWDQNALLTINTSSKTLTATPAYYVFRHLAQFVVPGAKVVATSGTGSSDALAFKNPNGTIVTVMYNSGSATTYTVSVGGQLLQFSMPSNGWATVVK